MWTTGAENFVRLVSFNVNKAGCGVKKIFMFLCLPERPVVDNIGIVGDVKVWRRTSVGGATLAGFARTFIKGRELEKSHRELLRTGNS